MTTIEAAEIQISLENLYQMIALSSPTSTNSEGSLTLEDALAVAQ